MPAPLEETPLSLFDPRLGEPVFRIDEINHDSFGPCRFNYFTVFHIREGEGTLTLDTAKHHFSSGSLIFFVPYQAFQLQSDQAISGHRLQFHANFFCIETHHEEIGCNGVLFNDLYGPPQVALSTDNQREIEDLLNRMKLELQQRGLAFTEILVSYLKIFLAQATRLKLIQQPIIYEQQGNRPAVLYELKDLIERNFRQWHKAGDYAKELKISTKALAKLVNRHLQTTTTELIRERILRQAKWEFLHTLKPVQQVANELGFRDAFYFSRIFKQSTGCSPTFFREFETEIRGGRNLSMPERD